MAGRVRVAESAAVTAVRCQFQHAIGEAVGVVGETGAGTLAPRMGLETLRLSRLSDGADAVPLPPATASSWSR